MLVELPDDSTLKLTGVLDWDAAYAHFCPKFVAYRAPFWMWIDDDADEWDETLATADPTDVHGWRLKRLFMQLASDGWKRYAFAPEYVLARRIFERLKVGTKGNGAITEPQSIVGEWQKIHFDPMIEDMDDLVDYEVLAAGRAKRARNIARRDGGEKSETKEHIKDDGGKGTSKAGQEGNESEESRTDKDARSEASI